MSEPGTLGDLIRERRLARGLSLGQLATAVGRTAATVRGWERDQHLPAPDVVERLAVSLDVEVDEIDGRIHQDPPSLTVISDEPDGDATLSDSTSVSGEALIETDEGVGDDDTAEVGVVESAPAAATEAEASFAAATADELGVMPKIELPGPEPDEPGPESEGPGPEPSEALEPEPSEPPDSDETAAEEADDPGAEGGIGFDDVAPPDAASGHDALDAPGPPPVAAAAGHARALTDEPTEAIGPPIAPPDPPAAAAPSSVAVRAEMLQEPSLPPFLAPLRSVFDPDKKWLYWVRGTLTVVALVVMLLVLAWAAGELFDGVGEVLDTIDSTDPLTSDVADT